MIQLTRNRLKESVLASDLPAINKYLDETAIPALERQPGIRAARAYNSMNGEVVIIIDYENFATLDHTLANRELGQLIAPLYQWFVRIGGEIMFDRGSFQAFYAKAPE